MSVEPLSCISPLIGLNFTPPHLRTHYTVSGDSLRTTEKQAIHCDSTASRTGFERVELMKALGVTISRKFSVVQHVDALLTGCAQTLLCCVLCMTLSYIHTE